MPYETHLAATLGLKKSLYLHWAIALRQASVGLCPKVVFSALPIPLQHTFRSVALYLSEFIHCHITKEISVMKYIRPIPVFTLRDAEIVRGRHS